MGLGLHARCGLPGFLLASAMCLRASSVAPVRGGTYFSLPPPQRRVGKRKRLTPPARVLIHGPPTSPCFTRQCTPHPLRIPVPGPAAANGVCRPGGKLCVGCRDVRVSALTRNTNLATQPGVIRVRRESLRTVCHLDGTNHSLTPALAWVPEAGETSIRSAGNEHQPGHCRVKHGDVGGPWIRIRAGGVSRFLLPTFLCGGKEK